MTESARTPVTLRDCWFFVWTSLLRPVFRIQGRWLFPAAPARVIRGVCVSVAPTVVAREEAFEKIDQSLTLIAEVRPRWFARNVTSGLRLLVFGRETRYWPSIGACVLAEELVEKDTIGTLSRCIVHEATHARLERSGVSYAPSFRARIERRCAQEEVEFLRRLPGDRFPGAERTARQVLESLESPWW